MSIKENSLKAKRLLKQFKEDKYSFGTGCLEKLGKHVNNHGKKTILIISQKKWAADLRTRVKNILNAVGVIIIEEIDSFSPNTPDSEVYKCAGIIAKIKPDSITCVGGGSNIDGAKAANIIASLSPDEKNLEIFFGLGKVSEKLKESNKKLYPLIAVQTVAGSAAHLTKYSNITIEKILQKKLIIDDVIIPGESVFDYSLTISTPLSLTIDGALDGLSHALEVYYGSNDINIETIRDISLTSISLIIETLPLLIEEPSNLFYREMIGLATDLGGYAIMVGGTNGPHLNSFSFVEILSHGRACGILNPYYTVFFSSKIREKLLNLIPILSSYTKEKFTLRRIQDFSNRKLGEIAAEALFNFYRKINFPTMLSEIKGFDKSLLDKALDAAKNPQLESKLRNMPVPLDRGLVEKYMKPVLEAAYSGDISAIRNIE